MSGPAIAARVGMPRSTVGAILRRVVLGKLKVLEPKPSVIRYERTAPGEVIHLDIKKLGRFQVKGQWVTGDRRAGRSRKAGWDFLHVCVDDASRLAYTVPVQRVMTDNGTAYRSRLFGVALQKAGARRVRTRPNTPHNGTAERFRE